MDYVARRTFAQLTVHGFFLEMLLAQFWAQCPAAEAEQAATNIKKLMRSAYLAPKADPASTGDIFEILQDSQEMAERFLEKVLTRAAQIRAQQKEIKNG